MCCFRADARLEESVLFNANNNNMQNTTTIHNTLHTSSCNSSNITHCLSQATTSTTTSEINTHYCIVPESGASYSIEDSNDHDNIVTPHPTSTSNERIRIDIKNQPVTILSERTRHGSSSDEGIELSILEQRQLINKTHDYKNRRNNDFNEENLEEKERNEENIQNDMEDGRCSGTIIPTTTPISLYKRYKYVYFLPGGDLLVYFLGVVYITVILMKIIVTITSSS